VPRREHATKVLVHIGGHRPLEQAARVERASVNPED
jgi:hypothetical protein